MTDRPCLECGTPSPGSYCPLHQPRPWRKTKPQNRVSGWSRQARNADVIRTFQGVCHWCGNPGATEVDHLTPVARGGSDERHPPYKNLRPIHPTPCHTEKTQADKARSRSQ